MYLNPQYGTPYYFVTLIIDYARISEMLSVAEAMGESIYVDGN